MAVWRSKVLAASTTFARALPRGFVPMVLVGDGAEEATEEVRIMVHVSMLKEPAMVALLDMAAQRFGYGQQGVLRLPCDESRFRSIVAELELVVRKSSPGRS